MGLRCIGIGARTFVVGAGFTVLSLATSSYLLGVVGLMTFVGMATAFLGLLILLGGLITGEG
jgi:hypothetical protein